VSATPGQFTHGLVRLAAIRESRLSVDEVLDAVADGSAGATVLFVGTVRDHDGGRGVERLGYSAHPSVEQTLRDVAEGVATRHPVRAWAAVHRVGDLVIGEAAVVVAVSADHRGAAFEACRALIDDLKAGVPIWKHQLFDDGSDEWVGLP
jgi:molybdopterin synthase catalytic subunit